jgi:O-antigen/teichoic acid export membrane protein
MAPFVAILALAMPFMTLQVMFAPVSNALGRPGITARISAVGALLMPCAFLIGIRFGAIGLAWGWLLAFPILTIVTIRLAGAPMGLRAGDMVKAAAPAALVSAAMAVVVRMVDSGLPPLPAPIHLAILVAVGGLAFAAILLLFARDAADELAGLVIRRTPAAIG